jgi:hypothetical protein
MNPYFYSLEFNVRDGFDSYAAPDPERLYGHTLLVVIANENNQ